MKHQPTDAARFRLSHHGPAMISSFALRSLTKPFMKAVLILFALASPETLQGQTCYNVPHPGTESISAEITINGTNIQVTDGMVLPRYSILRIDSVATAEGSCTGMAWNNSSCEPTGFTWQRTPSHTYVWVDVLQLNSSFAVGNVWPLYPDMHVIDTKSSDTTGPNSLWLFWQGTYEIHLFANINATPCNLAL